MLSCLTKNSDCKLQIEIIDIHTSEKEFFDLNIPILKGDYYFHQSKYFCCIIDYIDFNCYIFNKCENFELINSIKVETELNYEVDFCNNYIIIYYPPVWELYNYEKYNCKIYNILTNEMRQVICSYKELINMVEYLIYYKYIDTKEDIDDLFLSKNKEIYNKYFK